MQNILDGLKEIALWFFLPTFAFAFALSLGEAIKNLFKKKEKEYFNIKVIDKLPYPDEYYQKVIELRKKHEL